MKILISIVIAIMVIVVALYVLTTGLNQYKSDKIIVDNLNYRQVISDLIQSDKTPDICEKVERDLVYWSSEVMPKDICYTEFAIARKDPTICNNTFYKESCLKAITEAETANWQSYRNGKYGFEIKYPENSRVEGSEPSYWCQEKQGIEKYSCLEFLRILPDGVNIVVYDNPSDFSTKEWLNQNMPSIFSKQCDSKEIKISEADGIKAICTNGARVIDNFVAKGNYLFMVGISLGLDSETMEQNANKIFSTFKFVEPTKLEVLQPENQLREGGTYSIKWNQTGLENKKVNIYLYAYQQDGKDIEPKIDYQYYPDNDLTPRYLIAKDVLVSQRLFNWDIPVGLFQRFNFEPAKYKIQVGDASVLSGWGIEVRNLPLSQSKSYIIISK